MIPIGYMAKRIQRNPDWLKSTRVEEICSVSGCISENFTDYIQYWKHNGYWLFDSPRVIGDVAAEHGVDLRGIRMFYYEAYPLQFNDKELNWESFSPEATLATAVEVPRQSILLGYDIVSFSQGNAPECSYLSCNYMAERVAVNQHCLLESLNEAKTLLERGVFSNCEPGPCRIFAVHEVLNDPSFRVFRANE